MNAIQRKKENQRIKTVVELAFLAAICLWPVFVVNKGIDLTDSGYYLANYQTAFSGKNAAQLPYILSNWLGGIFYHLFPAAQYIVLRIVCLVSYAAINIATYVSLKRYFSSWVILAGLAFASMLVLVYPYIASYNTFSFLFLAASILLLIKALEKDSIKLLACAGVLVGLNTFNRMPNLLQFSLLSVCFWYYGFCLSQWKKAVKRSVQFGVVALAMLGLVLALFLATNQSTSLRTEFDWLFRLASAPNQNYNLWQMLELTGDGLLEGLRICICHILPFFLLWQAALLLSRKKKSVSRMGCLILWVVMGSCFVWGCVAVLFGWIILPYFPVRSLRISTDRIPYLIFILSLLCSVPTLLRYRKKNPLLSALAGVDLILALCIPLGTNSLFSTYYVYTHYLLAFLLGAFPVLGRDISDILCRSLFPNRTPIEKNNSTFIEKNVGTIPIFLVGALLAFFMSSSYSPPYRDEGYPLLDTPVQNVPLLHGVNTTPTRARILEDYYLLSQPYKNLSLISIGDFPLAYPLTNSRSFFSIAWPDLDSFPLEDFAAQLQQAKTTGNWPLVTIMDIDLDGMNAGRVHLEKKKQLLDDFILQNSYVLVSDNAYFQVYAPQEA